jgi:hypothetical protein
MTVSSPEGPCFFLGLSVERSRPGDLGHDPNTSALRRGLSVPLPAGNDPNTSAFLVEFLVGDWTLGNLTYNATWTDPATGTPRQASGPAAPLASAGSRPVAFEDRIGSEERINVGDRFVVHGRDADLGLWNETGVLVGSTLRCL